MNGRVVLEAGTERTLGMEATLTGGTTGTEEEIMATRGEMVDTREETTVGIEKTTSKRGGGGTTMTGGETKNVVRVLAMTTTDVNPHRILPTHPSRRQEICIRIVVEDMEEGGHLVGWATRIGLGGAL
jgi:hypothetical protein